MSKRPNKPKKTNANRPTAQIINLSVYVKDKANAADLECQMHQRVHASASRLEEVASYALTPETIQEIEEKWAEIGQAMTAIRALRKRSA